MDRGASCLARCRSRGSALFSWSIAIGLHDLALSWWMPCSGRGGGGVVVVEDREVDDDLVRDMTEVLTSLCARLYGRSSARRRAERAVAAVRK